MWLARFDIHTLPHDFSFRFWFLERLLDSSVLLSFSSVFGYDLAGLVSCILGFHRRNDFRLRNYPQSTYANDSKIVQYYCYNGKCHH